MGVFMNCFTARLAPDVHAWLVVDGVGWHPVQAYYFPEEFKEDVRQVNRLVKGSGATRTS